MKSPFSAIVAIGSGLVVLAGYFIDTPGHELSHARTLLLSWAVIIAAFAVLIGVINLLSVHWKKMTTRQKDAPYSVVLIVAFALTVALGIAENFLAPGGIGLQQLVTSIQVPVEASLLAILAVSLLYAAVRLLRQRHDPLSILFLASAVIFMILGSGLLSSFNVPFLNTLADALNRLPVAGMRGILLGVALGSLTTGLRILMGADRPYKG
jgi:hypothetical protein